MRQENIPYKAAGVKWFAEEEKLRRAWHAHFVESVVDKVLGEELLKGSSLGEATKRR